MVDGSRGGLTGTLTARTREDTSSRTQTPLVKSETPSGLILHPGSILFPEEESAQFQSASASGAAYLGSSNGGQTVRKGTARGRNAGEDKSTLESATSSQRAKIDKGEDELRVSFDASKEGGVAAPGDHVPLLGTWQPIDVMSGNHKLILSDDDGDDGL